MAKTSSQTKYAKLNPREALRRFSNSFEDLLESIEYASPKFWKDLDASRKSGIVSAKTIERRLGLSK